MSIFAQPSVLSSASFNDLYAAFAPDKVDSNGEGATNESFSEPINTDVNECKSKKNVCSINSQCIDEQILYRCACDDNLCSHADRQGARAFASECGCPNRDGRLQAPLQKKMCITTFF